MSTPTDEIVLYHAPRSRSSIVLWMLEETGAPYQVQLLDLEKGDQHQPAFLAVNPLGKVPALTHGGVVITEVAAICAHLADAFPAAGLAPPIGDRRRGPYLRWLFLAPGVLEPALLDSAFPRAAEPRAAALGWRPLDQVLDLIAAAIAPGPFLLGESFSAADLVLGSTLRYGLMFNLIPERPDLRAYVDRLTTRPAFTRTEARNQAVAGQT